MVSKAKLCGLCPYTEMTQTEQQQYLHALYIYSEPNPTPERFLEFANEWNKQDFNYKYHDNMMSIDFDYHLDAIYIEMFACRSPIKIPFLVQQLLGRYRTRNIVLAHCPRALIKVLNSMPTHHVHIKHSMAIIGRIQHHKTYHGILRKCSITLKNQETIHHDQIIQVHENDVYIYFSPPLVYDSNKLSGDLATRITSQVATCGDPQTHWKPRWNKLELCTNYSEKTKIIYTSPHYKVRQKMKISLRPLPCKYDGYKEEYAEYQTYARQVLFHFDLQAKRIQRAWRRAISDPAYTICRNRLTKEFSDMV